jgi:phosphoenolpyruvate carboxykinase (ATP)
MLSDAMNGKLDGIEFRKDKLFGFSIPKSCPGVPDEVFEPSNAWGDKDDYWRKYDALVSRYIENFKLYADGIPNEVLQAGPKRLNK